MTDKNTTNIISRTGYEGSAFTHQGWVLDKEWQEFLVLDDEYDEYDKTDGGIGKPITYFWDIKSLEAPKLTGFYRHSRKGIDHNRKSDTSPIHSCDPETGSSGRKSGR